MENKAESKNVEKDKFKKRTCFIITPIGQENSEIRRHIDGVIDEVISPILSELNYDNPVVSHRDYTTGLIVKSVVNKIVNSDLVIANLTTLNANVMYELAIRHAIGKPVVCIAEKGTKLPFDTSDERTIFYSNDIQGAYELKEVIKKYINSIDYSKAVFENPITNSMRAIKLETELFRGDTTETDKFTYLLEKVDNIENALNAYIKRFRYNERPRNLKENDWTGNDSPSFNEILRLIDAEKVE